MVMDHMGTITLATVVTITITAATTKAMVVMTITMATTRDITVAGEGVTTKATAVMEIMASAAVWHYQARV